MIRQYELVERVKAYDPTADEDALNRAYVFAMKAHGSQKRASGDLYFSHPLEVAGILTGMRLDTATIITALLHDTIEDTDVTLAEIDAMFGKGIASLVDGVTKLTRLELQSDQTRQAENFRKLLLAMSEDIRVLLVKLADRLHNMRTLHFIKDETKRWRVANETMDIFAPLAERIGTREIKDELEDLSFIELNPQAHDSLKARLEFLRKEGGNQVPRIIKELKRTLGKAGIEAEVSGREKQPYSIWRKMERKNVEFEQLSDIVAFRIVVDTVEQCYATLGVVHAAYPMVPGRFKDHISTPKPNGYQSVHTAVIGPENMRIEIQIRTKEMQEFAEHGVAAHWHYKSPDGKLTSREGRQYRWIRELLEILDHAAGPEEFLEHTKLEMFPDQVFCFTPKGDLIALPAGATPVDFAYAVHSEIGDTCVGAKINGRMKPLRTELQNGDQVEIICSKTQTPSPTWERFIVTGKARSHIRRFVRLQRRAQYHDLGKTIMQKAFREIETR
ncbi:MAG: bifunctional (p)ppGpp synthetase/guanosine-3',5'-bis(diphosphate) 3'-pyrophosphohydrolase, partial [Nitrospira sp.]|nr:bifunctional (p)ppGpp synthetase/guanosine-3',5'-bis(diphosphate) 3'-pyrophosphohydrolase [Nitrospira sp.]